MSHNVFFLDHSIVRKGFPNLILLLALNKPHVLNSCLKFRTETESIYLLRLPEVSLIVVHFAIAIEHIHGSNGAPQRLSESVIMVGINLFDVPFLSGFLFAYCDFKWTQIGVDIVCVNDDNFLVSNALKTWVIFFVFSLGSLLECYSFGTLCKSDYVLVLSVCLAQNESKTCFFSVSLESCFNIFECIEVLLMRPWVEGTGFKGLRFMRKNSPRNRSTVYYVVGHYTHCLCFRRYGLSGTLGTCSKHYWLVDWGRKRWNNARILLKVHGNFHRCKLRLLLGSSGCLGY